MATAIYGKSDAPRRGGVAWKQGVLIAVLLVSVVSCAPQAAQPSTPTVLADAHPDNPMIHQQGRQIVDGMGHPIELKGTNVEGWVFWNGWVWGGGVVPESTMLERLDDLVGPAETARFRQAVYDTYITEADIAAMADLGFNVVRVQFNHLVLEDDANPFVYKQSGWNLIDRLLAWCEKYHIYVVFVMNSAPGGQFRGFTADPDQDNILWRSQTNQDRTVALWRAIAERYKDRTIIAGYDLVGEPNPPSDRALVELYRRIIAAIREVDAQHMVILEGASFARDFSMFDGPISGNQAYSFHMYPISIWPRDPRPQRLAGYKTVSQQHDVPMWCGEFGENKYDIVASGVKLMDDPQYEIRGWAYWTWKKASNSLDTPTLNQMQLTANARKLIGWIGSFSDAKPTQAEALAGIQDFLAAIPLDKTRRDPQMQEALLGR